MKPDACVQCEGKAELLVKYCHADPSIRYEAPMCLRCCKEWSKKQGRGEMTLHKLPATVTA